MKFYCQKHDFAGDAPCTTCEEIDAANGIAPKSVDQYILEACEALENSLGGSASPVADLASVDIVDMVQRLLAIGCDLEDIGLFSCVHAFQCTGHVYSIKGANRQMTRIADSLCKKNVLLRGDNGELLILPIDEWGS